MQQVFDSSASGYLMDSFEGLNQHFTDVEIISTSDVNVVAKAKRYGRWWLLKGLRKEIAGEGYSKPRDADEGASQKRERQDRPV